MNGDKIFVDTNICIYLLNGDRVLAEFLQNQNVYISVITEMELYVFDNNESSNKILDDFIASVNVLEIDDQIKRQTIKIRKSTKLKLPDSIIAAAALVNNIPFLTADKALKRVPDLDLILYENANL